MYVCEPFPMFELGSVHYDRYVLNVRLPAFDEGSDVEKINTNIGKLEDLHLVVGSDATRCVRNIMSVFYMYIHVVDHFNGLLSKFMSCWHCAV